MNNCRKIKIPDLAAKQSFRDFWRCFSYVNQRCKVGLRALLQQFGQFLRDNISRSVLRVCMKLHSLVLRCQTTCRSIFIIFEDVCYVNQRGAKLDSEALWLKQFIQTSNLTIQTNLNSKQTEQHNLQTQTKKKKSRAEYFFHKLGIFKNTAKPWLFLIK